MEAAKNEKITEFHEVKVVTELTDEVNALTHTHPHHADESFATAILSFLQPMTVYCTRDQQIIDNFNNFIYDIGGDYDHEKKHYDHHQRDFREQHLDGHKMAAAGLVWRHYGEQVISQFDCPTQLTAQVAALIDRELFSGLDANDNGELEDGPVITLPATFKFFNPNWDEDADFALAFESMCRLAQQILQRVIIGSISYAKGQSFVDAAITKAPGQYFVMYKNITNWTQMVVESPLPQAKDLLYGITKDSASGTWRVRAIPPSTDYLMATRKKFPIAWRGLRDAELAKATGVESAQFCHAAGFLAIAGTKADAIRLAELAIATPDEK